MLANMAKMLMMHLRPIFYSFDDVHSTTPICQVGLTAYQQIRCLKRSPSYTTQADATPIQRMLFKTWNKVQSQIL